MVKFTKKDCEANSYTYIHSTTHIPIGAHSFCTLGQHKSFTLFFKYYGCLNFGHLKSSVGYISEHLFGPKLKIILSFFASKEVYSVFFLFQNFIPLIMFGVSSNILN